jgi:hypothetical protein
MGPYGSHHMITPNFDALANESLVFERAYIGILLEFKLFDSWLIHGSLMQLYPCVCRAVKPF